MADFGLDALDVESLTPDIKAALKDFLANVAHHSRKQSALVDVLVSAVKALNHDLQQEKMRADVLDERISESEARLDELARAVDALRRQGWVQ